MAYIKNTWVDQQVERPKTYEMVNNSDGSVTLVDSFGLVSELGTPVNADNMNHIEDGIEDHEDRITILEEGQDTSNFLNKTQITNCLLEVPQRIKLELIDGVLTLKAGSVVIVPNGFEADGVTKKFDYVTVESDVSTTPAHLSTEAHFLYRQANGGLFIEQIDQSFSGITAPTGYGYMKWYDTANNLMKATNDGGVTWISGHSLPLCIYHSQNNVAASIDQIFNGFGHIGSTAWVDKGVKGLVPNGRHEDGSLKNIEFVTDTLLTEQLHDAANVDIFINIVNGKPALFTWTNNLMFHVDKLPTNPINAGRYYVIPENKWYFWNNGWWSNITEAVCYVGKGIIKDNRYENIVIKQPFRAIDYSDAVKKSGDTMTGTLTVEADGQYTKTIAMKSKTIDISTNASFTSNDGLYFVDKNGNGICWFVVQQENGTTNTALSVGYNANENPNFLGFNFPKATTHATTVSSASYYRPAEVVQNYVNGTSWYRVYSDGWCEQGGRTDRGGYSSTPVMFLRPFANTNYSLLVTYTNMEYAPGTAGNANSDNVGNCTTTGFSVMRDSNFAAQWEAKGYIL